MNKGLFLVLVALIGLPFILMDYMRAKDEKIKNVFAKFFAPILREKELSAEKLCGASWVIMAILVNFSLFREEIAITAFVILVICDTLAALVGKAIPSEPFFEKTRNGSLAFFISGILVLFICGLIFSCGTWFYVFGIFSLAATTVIEARPSLFSVDDNFTIPISFALTLTAFDMIWKII